MKNKIIWTLFSFCELSTSQLYDILHLRNKVFAVEQNDVYLDVDYKDQDALHLLGSIDEKLAVYCRIFPPSSIESQAKIGRVVVSPDFRKFGLGRSLMKQALQVVDETLCVDEVFISAQVYLQEFYESLGFVAQDEPYLDGTIQHVDMVRTINK